MFLNLGTPPHGPPPPFAAWSLHQIRIVERAIACAWTSLSATPEGRQLVGTGTEPQITAALQDGLIDVLNSGEVAGFTPAAYGCPVRGQEVENHSGQLLEKRPDLTFPRLSSRPVSNHNALFYECKIVGRGRSVDDYVSHGVARFQEGVYAWAMPHAGMIAYVFDPVPAAADRALVQVWSKATTPTGAFVPIAAVGRVVVAGAPGIVTSIHARSFVLRNGLSPGDITLRHLWLSPG